MKQICVIGAGVMGAQIAAHMANAGANVLLLDIVDGAAEKAVARMLKSEPAAFMHPKNARAVSCGTLDDNLEHIKQCDWIVEAIIERPDIKQALYEKLDDCTHPDAVISSNTSTIPLAYLLKGRSAAFKERFLITHFFNPPRYMRLLEIVTSGETRPDLVEKVSQFADHRLGKTVINCHDTPGFIANRLGIFWLMSAVHAAIDQGIDVEQADQLLSKPVGIPKSGVFGLLDLVGLDLMPHVTASMAHVLKGDDLFHCINKPLPLIEQMIADGYTGRKGKGGFYRLNDGMKEAIDLSDGSYSPALRIKHPEAKFKPAQLRKFLQASPYAWSVLSKTCLYAAQLMGEAAETVVQIDEAMKLGYNWKYGPFELIDFMGADWFAAQLIEEGYTLPPILEKARTQPFYDGLSYLTEDGPKDIKRAPGILVLGDIKKTSKPLLKNASAALWDVGDGVTCFEFTSKMNTLDQATMQALHKSIAIVGQKYKGMVLYNEGSNFSVGANLGLALFAANIAAFSEIEGLVKGGQDSLKLLKNAPFPVVGAPSGMALGGGCEFLLHCDAIQAHAESYIGLVEAGVGLIPAWGGCKEMLQRWCHHPKAPNGPMAGPSKVFEMLATAQVAKSAFEAKEMGFLSPNDSVTMNRDRLLYDAKEKLLSMVEGYQPRPEAPVTLSGQAGRHAFEMAVDGFVQIGKATPHDTTVARRLAHVLTGGENGDITTEQAGEDILALERDQFMKLVKTPESLARIEHMVINRKPLRN